MVVLILCVSSDRLPWPLQACGEWCRQWSSSPRSRTRSCAPQTRSSARGGKGRRSSPRRPWAGNPRLPGHGGWPGCRDSSSWSSPCPGTPALSPGCPCCCPPGAWCRGPQRGIYSPERIGCSLESWSCRLGTCCCRRPRPHWATDGGPWNSRHIPIWDNTHWRWGFWLLSDLWWDCQARSLQASLQNVTAAHLAQGRGAWLSCRHWQHARLCWGLGSSLHTAASSTARISPTLSEERNVD